MTEAFGEKRETMSCAEFHKELPFLMESGTDMASVPHLKDCQNCSDLVRDLQYIADQAKLLLPMHDPNPRVWTRIKDSLQKEGLPAKEGRMQRLAVVDLAPQPMSLTSPSWHNLAWAAALAIAILIGITLLQYLIRN